MIRQELQARRNASRQIGAGDGGDDGKISRRCNCRWALACGFGTGLCRQANVRHEECAEIAISRGPVHRATEIRCGDPRAWTRRPVCPRSELAREMVVGTVLGPRRAPRFRCRRAMSPRAAEIQRLARAKNLRAVGEFSIGSAQTMRGCRCLQPFVGNISSEHLDLFIDDVFFGNFAHRMLPYG